MKKLLEIRIDPSGNVSFESEYRPLKGMNLYQQVFVALLFESNSRAVNRWMDAIRILALADVCASDRPELTMSMFEQTLCDLALVCEEFRSHLGGNLNFKLATV